MAELATDTRKSGPGSNTPVSLRLPFRWKTGEHLSVIGETGSGKTMLISALIRTRKYVISLKSKSDETKLPGQLVRTAKDIDNPRYTRFVLHPSYDRQRYEFAQVLDRVWKQGGWTVNIDELYQIDSLFRLGPFVNRLLTQGRSEHISVVCGMQRPVSVTRFALSQAAHVIVFAQEGRDLKTVIDATTPRMDAAVKGLKRYQFAWYSRRDSEIWVGKLQDLLKGSE